MNAIVPPTSDTPPWLLPRTAYLHLPFCGHQCGYCDFAVTAGQDHLIELYLDALLMEVAADGPPRPVESLFLGGGTPTYLSATQLDRLLGALNSHFPQSPGTAREWSIESTPESLSPEKIAVLAAHGVNRISIGVQSFHAHLLSSLDRQHGVSQITQALEFVRPHIASVSLDLIFGAPGQTAAEWVADLETAIQYHPDHISAYGLTYEKGTPLWKARERGTVTPVSEDRELEFFLETYAKLPAAGYAPYEISNFATPDHECRHNQRYWANHAYYGYGVGAARYVGGRRELNVRDTTVYIRRVLAGESPTFQTELLDDDERAWETLAVQLRRTRGIDRAAFLSQTGYELDNLASEAIANLVEHDLLDTTPTHLALTPRGRCVADGVVEQLLKARRTRPISLQSQA